MQTKVTLWPRYHFLDFLLKKIIIITTNQQVNVGVILAGLDVNPGFLHSRQHVSRHAI